MALIRSGSADSYVPLTGRVTGDAPKAGCSLSALPEEPDPGTRPEPQSAVHFGGGIRWNTQENVEQRDVFPVYPKIPQKGDAHV